MTDLMDRVKELEEELEHYRKGDVKMWTCVAISELQKRNEELWCQNQYMRHRLWQIEKGEVGGDFQMPPEPDYNNMVSVDEYHKVFNELVAARMRIAKLERKDD